MLTPLNRFKSKPDQRESQKRKFGVGLSKGEKSSRVNNVGVYTFTSCTFVLVLVESTESESLAVRDTSETLKEIEKRRLRQFQLE
jgi:hypothetical protein